MRNVIVVKDASGTRSANGGPGTAHSLVALATDDAARKQPGSGLGLSIVWRIAQSFGRTVQLGPGIGGRGVGVGVAIALPSADAARVGGAHALPGESDARSHV